MLGNFYQFGEHLYTFARDGVDLMFYDAMQRDDRAARVQQELPKDATETIQKISRIADSTVEFSYYASKACWYFTAFNVVCHLFTRLFSTVALTYFVTSVFFGVLSSDFANLHREAQAIQRKCLLIQGPDRDLEEGVQASLNEKNIEVSNKLTKAHLQDINNHIETLYDSIYILKYPLLLPLEKVSDHLKSITDIL